MSKGKNVGLLTFHNAVNYGAILQCYALQSYLEETFGASVSVINYTPKVFKRMFFDKAKPLSAPGLFLKAKNTIRFFVKHSDVQRESKKRERLLEFANRNFHLTETLSDVTDLNKKAFDLVIVGSDQVWNLKLLDGDKSYLLERVIAPKVSYAASFKTRDVDDRSLNAYRECLSRFDAVSVREEDSSALLAEKLGIKNECLVDPTLLLTRERWARLIAQKPIDEPYVLIYHVNPPIELVERAFDFAKKKGLRVVSLNPLNRPYCDYLDYSDCSIETFLSLVYYSDCVFTTSFHGMAFSIIFEKDFYYEVPDNSSNNNQRLLGLATKLGVVDRELNHCFDDGKINWKNVNDNLLVQREKSFSFLKSVCED